MKKRFMIVGLLLVLALATSAQAVPFLAFGSLGDLLPTQNIDLDSIPPIESAVPPVPIPGSLVLLGSALASLAGIRLFRRS